MIEVKMPILLDSELNPSTMLYPSKGTLTLNMNAVSEASLTLREQDEPIPMHAWVKIYNQLGFTGIFRRTSQDKNITVDRAYTLRHGIDILQDSIWQANTDFSGTVQEFLTQLLNQQTHLIKGVRPWMLGTCADTSTIKKSINYDSLLELFESIVEDGSDYYFTYDQTVWPWRVSLVQKSSEVASEFRLSRNIEKCKIKDNDSELCTRLILNVNALATNTDINKQQNVSVMRTYDNTAAQAVYGIITKTADIDTEDSLPGGPFPEADRWAANFMARRAQPQVQIQIDGSILAGITGDTWDESRIGTMCRVALPDYAESISERVVSVNYPDLYGTPDKVSVSLANALPKFSSSVKSITRSIARTARGGRGSARAQKDFKLHFEYADEAGNILKQAGMQLDPDGLLVYADDNVNMVGARFNVQADKIGMVVGTNEHGNYVKAGEIALAINSTTGESTAMINATHVNISGTNTVHALAGDLEHDANGNLIIKNAGGLYVRRTEDGITSEFGVYDNGNLTGGIMVNKINGNDVEVKIKAARVDLGAYATVGELNAVSAEIQNLTGGTIVESYVGASLVTGATVTANNTLVHDGDTIYKRAMRWTSGGSVIATVHALGDTSSIILNHSHAMSVDSSGVVTVGDAQASSGTFNIADTAFHKARVASAWNSGGATAYADKSSQYAPYGGSVVIKIKYKDHDGNEQDTGRSVTIWNTDCSHTFKEQTFTSNGTYYASSTGYSGYSKVVISVRTTRHTNCADSLTKSGTHALMYVPDSSGITITTKVKNISNASRVWYYRGSDQDLFTAYT